MQDKVNVEGKKWEFNDEVSKCFDNMLERSIPQYELMRDLTFKIGSEFVSAGSNIVDIGCSNGRAIQPFCRVYGDDVDYYLYDVSEPMLAEAKKNLGNVNIENRNVTEGFSVGNCSLILSILTLQFTPIEYRHKIVKNIYDNLNEGGALILVEKVLGNTFEIDDILVNKYYGMKKEHQYTEKQIKDKRKSLEGVLVPITAAWNEDLLRQTGFKHIDCFWRCLNFCGWIAIK